MPSPNRNRKFNKEAAKVNAGLEMRSANRSYLSSRIPVIHFQSITLSLPVVVPIAPLNAEDLIQVLLHPPLHAFPYGMLSIVWVIGAVGMRNFEFRETHGRYVMKKGSILHDMIAQGKLPAIYSEWLCGGEEEAAGATAADMEICLTKDYFAELEIGCWEEFESKMEKEFVNDDDGDGNDGRANRGVESGLS